MASKPTVWLALTLIALAAPAAARADSSSASTIDVFPDKPGASFANALEKARPGDTVLVHAGTYSKTHLVITLTGRADAPITIKAAPGEKVVLDGEGGAERVDDESESKSLIPAIVDIRNSRYVTVEGFEVMNSVGYGVATWESENIVVRGCRIRNTWSRALGGNGAHLLFENNEVYNVVLQNENEAVPKANARGQHRFWSAGAATWYRADGSLSRDVTWRGNKISRAWGEGLIALHVDGAVLEGNEISNSYSTLIYIDHSRNVRVDGNFVYYSSRDLIRSDVQDVSPGIMWAAESYAGTQPIMPEHLSITNNIIVNVQVGIGFWRDPSNTSPTNRYNNVVIANNLIKDVSVAAISVKAINTDNLGATRDVLANNIIYQAGFFPDSTASTALTVRLQNPELWQVTNNLFPNGLVDLAPASFHAFQGNITGSPALVDPRAVNPQGARGFLPKTKSPLKAAGLALPEVTDDFDGDPRAATGPISIGPFEFAR